MGNVIPLDEDDTPEVKDQIRKTVEHAIQTLRKEEQNLRIAAENEPDESQRELFELADSAGALTNRLERRLEQLKRGGLI